MARNCAVANREWIGKQYFRNQNLEQIDNVSICFFLQYPWCNEYTIIYISWIVEYQSSLADPYRRGWSQTEVHSCWNEWNWSGWATLGKHSCRVVVTRVGLRLRMRHSEMMTWCHGGDRGAARDEMNDKRTGWQGLGWIDKGRISWVDNGDKGRVENASPRDEWADNFGRITFPHRGHRAQLSPKLKLTFSISNTVAKSQKKLQSAAKLIFGDVFALD